MKRLSLQEQHSVLLELAKVFDKICTENNIPYFMLGGTMLGAIRHNGFIPWDDDMDFGVPYEYFEKLEKVMNKQLSSNFNFYTFENSDSVFYPFAKLSDERTILDDKQIPLPIERKIGINIDIFPLYHCQGNLSIHSIHKVLKCGGVIYTDSRTRGIFTKVTKKILRFFCPFSRKWFIRKATIMASNIPDGPYLANIFGRWREKEICPLEWYGHNERYKFEDTTLCGLKKYDLYLKRLYGDYMTLPPTEKRFVHSEIAYLK